LEFLLGRATVLLYSFSRADVIDQLVLRNTTSGNSKQNMELNFPITVRLSNGDSPVIIDIAKPDVAEEIGEFFMLNFTPVSPNSELQEYDASPPEIDVQKQQFWLNLRRETLSQLHSMTVREQSTGRLVAVIYNRMETPTTEHPEFPKRLVTAILQTLTKDHNLFTLYETDKVLDIIIVTVSSDFGRKGLATKLMELSIQLAIQSGAGAIQVEAVSEYTARAASKLGFEILKSIDYATFEYDGIKPLAGKEKMLSEHPAARLMARRLP